MKIAATLALLTALAACSGTAQLYPVGVPAVGDKIRVSIRSLEVREVSLPAYAASDEIHVQGADGALTSASGVLWADQPARAMSLELARALSELTGSRVASEPWPFDASPQARLEVRMEELLAGSDGIFRASGQYFVASFDARETSGFFRLTSGYDPAAGPAAIAAARGDIIVQLARLIARDGL